MKKLMMVALLAGIGLAVYAQRAELKRYGNISRM